MNERNEKMASSDEKSGGNVFSWLSGTGPSLWRFIVLLFVMAFTIYQVTSLFSPGNPQGLRMIHHNEEYTVAQLDILFSIVNVCVYITLTSLCLIRWVQLGKIGKGVLSWMRIWSLVGLGFGGFIGGIAGTIEGNCKGIMSEGMGLGIIVGTSIFLFCFMIMGVLIGTFLQLAFED